MDRENHSIPLFGNSPFLNIFKSFRMAIHPSKMAIAFAALVVLFFVGWVTDQFTTVVTTPREEFMEMGRIEIPVLTELDVYLSDPDRVETFAERYGDNGETQGAFTVLVSFTISTLHDTAISLLSLDVAAVASNLTDLGRSVIWSVKYHPIFSLIYFLIELAVMAFAGGAICRIAALQTASNEKPGAGQACKYSCERFISYFTAPLAPVGIIIFVGLFVLVLGLLGNIPYVGELIVGLGMPFALMAGAIIALVTVGLIAGCMLLFPAVAYDGADAFDAISRAFSYIYTKPWRTGFYVIVASVYGAICYLFVRLMVFLVLMSTYSFVQLGTFTEVEGVSKLEAIWKQPAFMNLLAFPQAVEGPWTLALGGLLVRVFVLIVVLMIGAFVISFFYSASTVIYSLLRKVVDNTDISEVYEYPEKPQADGSQMPEEAPAEPASGEETQAKEESGSETPDKEKESETQDKSSPEDEEKSNNSRAE